MTAAEAIAIARAAQGKKELTPEKLAHWMKEIYRLIENAARDGRYVMSLGDFLCSRNNIERDGHLPAIILQLKAVGFDVRLTSVTHPLITWYPE